MYGAILLGVAFLVILWVILSYNSLVRLRNQVEASWRQIDVQLKRRHDLIPNLVSAVKGAMEFERDTLARVIEARAKALSAGTVKEKGSAEGMLTSALGRLFALFENYPELKSNRNVLELQEELTSTENRIGFSRQFYNDMVMQYNTRQQVFPSSVVASAFGFREADYFQAEEAAKGAPSVDLSMK